MDYLEYIYKMSIGIYSSEQSMIVKEKILKLTAKIMEKFPVDIVEKIYKPKQYLENLLNEIRLSKLTSTIKGGIWSIIGILIGKFSILLNSYKIEVHDVIFADFKKIVAQKKPEIKALQGILKGYEYLLDDPHLKANDIEELYHYLKSLIHPLDDANTIKINKLALKVISEHGKVFTQQLQRESIELFDLVFELCNHKNYELKMCANEAIEKICMHISDCLLEKSTLHKDIFKYLLRKIEEVLEKRSQYIMINTAISLIGIFSDAIVRFMGKNILE